LITEPVYSISRAIHTVSELTVSQQSKNKKLSYRKQIARKQCAHSNDRKFQGRENFTGKECGTPMVVADAVSKNFSVG